MFLQESKIQFKTVIWRSNQKIWIQPQQAGKQKLKKKKGKPWIIST